SDGGLTWSAATYSNIVSVKVEGSLLRLDNNVILFSTPVNTSGPRVDMTLWMSISEAQGWVPQKVVHYGPAGYSDMSLVGLDTLLVAYGEGGETGSLVSGQAADQVPNNSYARIGLERINLRWLQSTDGYQFRWNFNEQPAGTSADTNGPSIQ